MHIKVICYIILILIISFPLHGLHAKEIVDFNPEWTVRVAQDASPVEKFAAEELMRYLKRQTGIELSMRPDDNSPGKCFLIGQTLFSEKEKLTVTKREDGDDNFRITQRGDALVLTGSTARGTLYAVYYFLELNGWHWPMPAFDYCRPLSEIPPETNKLFFPDSDIHEEPVFVYRGGLCITSSWKPKSENFRRLMAQIDWMAKQRLNVLGIHIKHLNQIPRNILEEAAKRGLRLTAEGHCWSFLVNKTGFDTEDCEKSLNDLVGQAAHLVQSYPGIDYYGPWSDDNSLWEFCSNDSETAISRASKYFYRLNENLKAGMHRTRLIIPAYQMLQAPSVLEKYPEDAIIYFCPIARDHGQAIFSEKSTRNRKYIRSLNLWESMGLAHQIVYYSYYRKHSWKGFPANLPWMMGREFNWAAKKNFYGIWNYMVSDDWLSYDLQHYIYARLSWNPDQVVENLIENYYTTVMEKDAVLILTAFHRQLEDLILTLDGGGFWGFSVRGMKRLPKSRILEAMDQLSKLSGEVYSIKGSSSIANAMIRARMDWCNNIHKRLRLVLAEKNGR
jgi:hypothetical protein